MCIATGLQIAATITMDHKCNVKPTEKRLLNIKNQDSEEEMLCLWLLVERAYSHFTGDKGI